MAHLGGIIGGDSMKGRFAKAKGELRETNKDEQKTCN